MKSIQQPYPRLAKALGVPELYIKREDQHPYGSHKGRAIPLMIKEYRKREGITDFVISSSGNAAIAAAITVQKHNTNNPGSGMRLRIFVGPHIDAAKRERIATYVDGEQIVLEQVENPKQQTFQREKTGQAKNLRQSTNDVALMGYQTLADELGKIPKLHAVFLPTSSGTTAQGVANGFRALEKDIQTHIVQTSACNPLATPFDTAPPPHTKTSLAGAIVDRVAHRKAAVEEAIRHSGGSGWIVSDDQIRSAMDLVRECTGISASANSALSIAGLQKALASGWNCTGPVVAVFTGQ